LGNLVKAVGAGLNLFITNIADHLKTGVVSWLLGTAVKAGLDLPAKFDLKGIIQLIGSMLGLTWDNIRTRVTRKGVPDEAMSAVETSVPVAKNLAAEGPAGAVKEIQAEAGDLKATILGKLTTYLIPTVLIAGITWIISLLNPASAFVRAVKGIIDIVTFIVTQGAQIADFVNAVLDAVIAIANGGQAGVPKLIETALATSIPLLIGFLAALLGIGGLANKVKSVFQSVSRPVTRAIDKIVDFIAKKGKALWAKLRGKKDPEKRNDKKHEGAKKEDKFSPISVEFTMSGAHHRIKVPTARTSKIAMHSTPGDLLQKINSAKTSPGIDAQQLSDLNTIETKAIRFQSVIDGHKAAKTQCPSNDPSIIDLLSEIQSYSRKYGTSDIDPLEAARGTLRTHPGYRHLQQLNLAEAFEARILANIDDFETRKIEHILDVIARLSPLPRFEQAKIERAIETNRFWSPNHGTFFEIGDLHAIPDVKHVDVQVGGRIIDTLTARGILIDQKYQVNLKNGVLDPRLTRQCQAMAAAVGSTVEGIRVTGWEIHYAIPLTQAVITEIASLNWSSNFKEGTTASLYR
ncbi:hypothetical protein ACWIGY_14555, partial [Streptomyces anulatus]